MISIILPVLNEGENLKILIPEIDNNLKKIEYEIIVVDDNSTDDTDRIINRLKKKYNIKYILRKDEKGLSSAVIEGFKNAKGEILIVMDSDLSHPPKVIPGLLNNVMKNSDIVIASRYVKGGGAEKWILPRKFISIFATIMAKPLVKVKDPLAGFFCLKKNVIQNTKLNPIGFKILLEILVKGNYKKIVEIPYIFQRRYAGKSKADIHIYLQYNLHLLKLYFYKIKQFLKRLLK